MRFCLVDQILEVQPGKMIRAVKNLTLGEEYLADHFPTFPVMPGVLMLQTLIEAGAWLLRVTDDFQHSVIVLREAKHVKYGTFMEPSRRMLIFAELIEQDQDQATFKGKGEVNGNATVSARFVVTRYNLRDRNPALRKTDERLIEHLRHLYTVLKGDLNPKTLLPAEMGERGARSAERHPANQQPRERRSPLGGPLSQARDGNG
jgi:3-hydroxyacyl-[acyl-carrier-protein] dehydratase